MNKKYVFILFLIFLFISVIMLFMTLGFYINIGLTEKYESKVSSSELKEAMNFTSYGIFYILLSIVFALIILFQNRYWKSKK